MNRLLAVPQCVRTEPSTLRWTNGSHWLTYRFAPSDWKAELHSRSVFQTERAKRTMNRLLAVPQRVRRNLRRCIGRIVRTGLQIASLPRLGKPSDYCCSAFQTERAKRTINRLLSIHQCVRTEPSTLRWTNGSHWLTYRFAPSAWKAERLFNSPSRPNGTYDIAFVESFAPVCRSLRSLGLESRATIQFANVSERNVLHCIGRTVRTGWHIASLSRLRKPSDYCCSAFQAERAKHTINRLQSIHQCVRTEPTTLRWSNCSHRFANRFAPSAWKAERLLFSLVAT